jgi:metallo-beta-lactamase class B
VVSNVYAVGTNEVGVFLITTRQGHILVDAGPEEAVPLVAAAVKELGYRYEDVRLLLSGHAHAEHAGGLARIKRETGAQVVATADAATVLARGGRGDPQVGDAQTFPAVTVDRVVEDGAILELGGQRILVRHTPGHAPGAATFVTTVQENGRGLQMVFAASTALDPHMQLAGNPRHPGAVSDWQRTYAVLESMVADVWVSGHPTEFDMAGKFERLGPSRSNPYIDPQGYRGHLFDGRTALNTRLTTELSQP